MKYVLTWKPRLNGHGDANEADFARALDAFEKWGTSDGLVFHEFLQRLDAEGGYAVIESTDPHLVLAETTKFAPWFECGVTPVVEMTDGLQHFHKGVEFRSSTKA
jgi:hypothetical protein